MSRKNIYRISIIFLTIIASLFICFLVARQGAIRNGIKECDASYGLQPVKSPTEAQAHLTTLGRAVPGLSDAPYAGELVWIVEMKGSWILVGGPDPVQLNPGDPIPDSLYQDECTIIIDALTGKSQSGAIE